MTAGLVSAEVAALTGKALKTMLINKLALTATMLMVVVGLAQSTSNLALRAGAIEPTALTKDAQKLREQTETHRGVARGATETRRGRREGEHPATEGPRAAHR